MIIKIGSISVSRKYDKNFDVLNALKEAGFVIVTEGIGYNEYNCIISRDVDEEELMRKKD